VKISTRLSRGFWALAQANDPPLKASFGANENRKCPYFFNSICPEIPIFLVIPAIFKPEST